MMSSGDFDSLFTSISSLLRTSRCRSGPDGIGLWQSRSSITAAEVDMLGALTIAPLCVDAIATRLQRDRESTQALLDGLVAVGVLEHCSEGYAASPTAELYCRALTEGWPFSETC